MAYLKNEKGQLIWDSYRDLMPFLTEDGLHVDFSSLTEADWKKKVHLQVPGKILKK